MRAEPDLQEPVLYPHNSVVLCARKEAEQRVQSAPLNQLVQRIAPRKQLVPLPLHTQRGAMRWTS